MTLYGVDLREILVTKKSTLDNLNSTHVNQKRTLDNRNATLDNQNGTLDNQEGTLDNTRPQANFFYRNMSEVHFMPIKGSVPRNPLF